MHIGGAYRDKRGALKRLCETLEENNWLLKRMALENDEKHYTVSEVIEVSESFGILAVYDHYHHKLNPSRFSVDSLLSTWHRVLPEVHISSEPSRSYRFGEHGDYLELRDFIEMLLIFPQDSSIDAIVEVKMKEKVYKGS